MSIHPTITYRVKLYDLINVINSVAAEDRDNVINQLNKATIQIKGIEGNLKHGDIITLYGANAVYMGQVYQEFLEVYTA